MYLSISVFYPIYIYLPTYLQVTLGEKEGFLEGPIEDDFEGNWRIMEDHGGSWRIMEDLGGIYEGKL